MEIDELLRRQDQLQAEAATVRQDLELDQRLSPLGEVVPVGSAALGLMVWPDLDLTVVCRRLDADAVAGAGASLPGTRGCARSGSSMTPATGTPTRPIPTGCTWGCGAAAWPGDLDGGHLVRR
jgi:hypothetical protein